MIKLNQKTALLRFVAALTIVLLFGVMFSPILVGALETDCEDCKECNDQEESGCDCVRCSPIILAYNLPLSKYDQTLNVLPFSIINPANNFKSNFLDLLFRPPRHSSTSYF